MRDMQAMTMAGGGAAAPGQIPDMTKVFKDEIDSMELSKHKWTVQNAEALLLGKKVPQKQKTASAVPVAAVGPKKPIRK